MKFSALIAAVLLALSLSACGKAAAPAAAAPAAAPLLKPLLHLPLLHLLLLLLQSNRLDKLDKKADASRLFLFLRSSDCHVISHQSKPCSCVATAI